MGSDMTNLKNSNLKVPPLKIVLSSATSGGSDRSTSTSPSSESESLDSNLTIISENQQERNSRSEQKDDSGQGRFDKATRNTARGVGSSSDSRVSNTLPVSSNASGSKRTHLDQNNDVGFDSTATIREPTSSSNQRITRSSQRAAQQNKSDNCNEINGDETNLADSQDKSISELGQRKVKRRKGEQAEATEDNNQQVQQQVPLVMANICPANYQLPSQNSFELYRDIRNRPHMKMMKLNLVPPKVPYGFRDYIIYGGPYLLEGNKVGLGLSGGRIDIPVDSVKKVTKTKRPLNRNRPSTNQLSFNQRHGSYVIPKSLEPPNNLKLGSQLYKLFQDQENARQKMRMQHLKERERSVLTSEQEILRAYNRETIADNQQAIHLSACTYFFYQERYHYVDEKSNYLDSINQKDSSQSRENSDSCNAENTASGRHQANTSEQSDIAAANSALAEKTRQPLENKDGRDSVTQGSEPSSNGDMKPPKKKFGEQDRDESMEGISDSTSGCDTNSSKSSVDGPALKKQDSSGEEAIVNNNSYSETRSTSVKSNGETSNALARSGVILAGPDQKGLDKAKFLHNLQEIDNKWAKIKDEMFVRHKNESDSLHAVQCLEWEWKAKEVGACDVRLSMKVDPEFVPKVLVSALDY